MYAKALLFLLFKTEIQPTLFETQPSSWSTVIPVSSLKDLGWTDRTAWCGSRHCTRQQQ